MVHISLKIILAIVTLVVMSLPRSSEAERFNGTVFIIDGPGQGAGPDQGSDADGDGLADEWEAAYGLDPLDPSDAVMDFDGDGLSALDECRYNTDPWDIDTNADLLADSSREGSEPPPGFTGNSDAVNDCELKVYVPI